MSKKAQVWGIPTVKQRRKRFTLIGVMIRYFAGETRDIIYPRKFI